MKRLVIKAALIVLSGMLAGTSFGASGYRGRCVVHIACFVPSDRAVLLDYRQRVDRVMKEVQRFYGEGMAAAGYADKVFGLDLDGEGNARIHVVYGANRAKEYGRNSSGQIRDEVKTALKARGLDIDNETVVIFEVLLDWDGAKATEVGPYVGGGGHLSGTAWVYDDRMLDPKLLPSKEPGGYYGRPCSIGEFNSHYIGGVAHELGHAFGLPHACQRKVDRQRGTALMGHGNHSYGQELRGEGRGTFLTETSAMMLAYTRPFSGDLENAKQAPQCEITEMKAVFADGVLVLAAHIKGSPRIYGIAAYNDPARYDADYDAVGWTCRPDSKGGFRLEIGELQTGKYQIRLLACHVNGAKSRFSYDYEVDADGKPSTEMFEYPALLKKAVKAYQSSNRRRLMAAISTLERRYGHIEIVKKKAACLRRLSQPRKLHSARTIPARVKRIDLSRIGCIHESVGWQNPMRDQVPIGGDKGCFLQVGGEVFTSGFYAHAPSSFKFELGGKWKSLSFGYGLQDGYGGSVVFVIRSDGKEAYRSPVVHGHRSHKSEIDVTGVGVLELVVEDGANGNNSDWGVWLEPVLTR